MGLTKKVLITLITPIILTVGVASVVKAATLGNVFADCRVKKIADYQSSSSTKNKGVTYGACQITKISHTGDTYRVCLKNSNGFNKTKMASFSDVTGIMKLKYDSDFVSSSENVHLNRSTAPTNFYSVTVYGCWTANYQ